MRPTSFARALASVAALSFSVAASAKAPHPRAASSGDAAPAPAPSAETKDPADAEAPAGAPSTSASPGSAPVPPASAPSASAPTEPGSAPPSDASPAPSGEPASPSSAEAPAKTPAKPTSPTTAPQVKQASPVEPEGDDVPDAITPARDTVGGHFNVGLGAALVLPFGDIRAGVPQSRTMGPGLSLGGDVAYGISRTVMLGAYVDVGLPSAEGTSSKNSIATIAAGPFIRYHLVQGLRFDPWVSGGLGFRRTSDGATAFTGVDWFRAALGGDWYPASNFGFGPFVELSLGTFFAESPGTIGAKALDAHFVIGGRIVFDGPGK